MLQSLKSASFVRKTESTFRLRGPLGPHDALVLKVT